jgi:membrane associated rhomboid family serine protease
MLPRYCLALMLTVGGVLAEFIGYEHPLWQTIAIVALGPIWVWVVHTIHAREGTPFARTLADWDRRFRVFMIIAIIASVGYHWVTGPLQPYPWLAAKLLIFAFLIFCGFMIRLKIPPFIEGFKVLASTGPTPESDQKMTDGMGACRPYVLAIWAGVAISALIGILKPGQ